MRKFLLFITILVVYSCQLSIAEEKTKALPQTALLLPFDTKAKQAVLIDFQTGTTLYAKNADAIMVPSSMTKIMTLYLLFSGITEQRFNLTDKFLVSERAWRMDGSKSFLLVGSYVSVEELIRAIIVQSGNDACIVVAEAISGSEEAFAEKMTNLANAIGAKYTVFKNSHGWPQEGHVSTARDMVTLAIKLMIDFPQFYKYFSEKEFTHSSIKQYNRNSLLWRNIGVDGLKTGHTDSGGYGIIASAIQNKRRLIGLVNGCASAKERSEEMEKILMWGFRETCMYTLAEAGEPIEEAEIWLGEKSAVGLVSLKNIYLTLPRTLARSMKVEVVYQGPVEAPIKKGQIIAKLRIQVPGTETREYPLAAADDVNLISVLKRAQSAISYLIFGAKR